MVSFRAQRIAGTGTMVNPVVGLKAGFALSSIDQVWLSPTTAGFVNFNSPDVFSYRSTTSDLYLRSQVNNAAADHMILTDIVIKFGPP